MWKWVLVGLLLAALGGIATGYKHGTDVERGRHAEAQQAWAAERFHLANAASAAQAAARAAEQSFTESLQNAQRDYQKREAALRANVGSLRNTNVGLLNHLSAARQRLPQAAAPACREFAGACSAVLGECTAAYSQVAADADQCTSARRALMDAWPRP
jgi:hypothetical protein